MPIAYYIGTVPGFPLKPSRKKLIWDLTSIFCRARNTLEFDGLDL